MPKKIDYVDWSFVDAKGTGLDIDFETGKIYGTPSCDPGTYNCRVKVWTNYGEAEEDITVKVAKPLPSGKGIGIGVDAVDTGETVYIPLSLFWKHVHPNEVTIKYAQFLKAVNTVALSSIEGTNYKVSFDKDTGNIIFEKTKDWSAYTFKSHYISVMTENGWSDWQKLYLHNNSHNLVTGDSEGDLTTVRVDGHTYISDSHMVRVGGIDSYKYRANIIY